MRSERQYIARVKRLIEEKFSFESSDGVLRQRDLEYLAKSIEATSGIKLSLSTLKRLWKKDYDQTPHPSTLEALVSLLGYKDWQEFKLKQTVTPAVSPDVKATTRYRIFNRWVLALPVAAALAVVFWLIAFRSREGDTARPVIKGPVTFKGNKTVGEGVPSTIIFNYDVSNIEADSFFFQQSWNDMERVKIDPKGHHYATIYYFPGFHEAKLFANDSIVSSFTAHITTDGWLSLFRYSYRDNIPVYFKKGRPVTNGALHLTRDLVSPNSSSTEDFLVSYFNVREFENTDSDNFSLETRVVCDSTTKACPGLELTVMCEADAFFVRLMGKGCEHDIAVKMGEVAYNGANTDLSVFGRDLYQWQYLKIHVANKLATIYLDEQPVHTISFKNDFGKIVGLACHFNGSGAVDYVRLMNGENGVVLKDEFVP